MIFFFWSLRVRKGKELTLWDSSLCCWLLAALGNG